MGKSKLPLMAVWILAGLLFQNPAAHTQVILGQSCAMSGPTSFLGSEMNRGARAYFDKYADDITLRHLDDRYEPVKCVENTNKFLGEKVTALFGYVGTPTAKVAIPLAMANHTLFFGAFTGAGFLNDPETNPYAFSVRASYDMEIENMLKHLKQDLGLRKIALFVQKDAFGLAGIKGAVRGAEKIGGIEIVPRVPEIPKDSDSEEKWGAFWNLVPNYKRNTIAVGRDARKISGNRDVEAVILVGAYRACAAAIRLWKKVKFDAVFMNISFVGSKALAESLGEDLKNVFISQVVPDPWNPKVPIVREYQKTLGQKENYGFVSLEGYIAARIMHKAAKDAADSASLKRALEAMSDYDVGGLKVSFGPNDHQGLDAVYLTRIRTKVRKGKREFEFEYVDKIAKE